MAKLNVKAGDKVLYQYPLINGAMAETEAIVTSVKGSKIQIDKSWSVYDQYGKEIDTKDNSSRISVLTEMDKQRIAQTAVIRRAYTLMQTTRITYGQALQIIELLS